MMNLEEVKKELIEKKALEEFGSTYLENEFAGFRNLLTSLVSTQHVLMAESAEIIQHLSSFPYFKIEASKEAVSCVDITFDLDSFVNSSVFQEYVELEISGVQKEIKEKKFTLSVLSEMKK